MKSSKLQLLMMIISISITGISYAKEASAKQAIQVNNKGVNGGWYIQLQRNNTAVIAADGTTTIIQPGSSVTYNIITDTKLYNIGYVDATGNGFTKCTFKTGQDFKGKSSWNIFYKNAQDYNAQDTIQ